MCACVDFWGSIFGKLFEPHCVDLYVKSLVFNVNIDFQLEPATTYLSREGHRKELWIVQLFALDLDAILITDSDSERPHQDIENKIDLDIVLTPCQKPGRFLEATVRPVV